MLALTLLLFIAALSGSMLYRAVIPKHVFYRRPLRPYVVGFCMAYGIVVLLLIMLAASLAASR